MLSFAFVRRTIRLCLVFGVTSIAVLGLVGLSVPGGEAVSQLRWRLLIAETLLLMVGVLIVARLLNQWLQPLLELTRAANQLAEGHHPDRVGTEYDDELGQFSQAFNEMVLQVGVRTTELQRSRQNAVSDNEQLATILEAMIEGVIAVGQDERILLANSAAIKLLDLKTFDVVGRRIWELIRVPQIHELVHLTLKEEKQNHLEVTVPWTYSIVAIVASRLPGNPCPGIVLVLHDVTELRRLENLRREFVSNVSHELKTPLAAISAYTETLLSGALEDRDVSHTFVGRISEQADRLNSLILDLLELARIESGEHIFDVVSVDVNLILRESLDAHHAIAQTKQLTLNFQPAEPTLMGQADSEGLRTTIDNLVGNAINYTGPGGVVTVRSRRDDPWVIFEVEDNGVGIAKEIQTRIFERFFRGDQARSREVGGTGLGLAIVKHLCQLFGGHVRVKSQIGQGSTFTVQLKASK